MSSRLGNSPAGLTLVASTPGITGYTKVNGTGPMCSWNVPNDGNIHRVLMFFSEYCTSAETNGQLALSATLPNGQAISITFLAAQGLGVHQNTINLDVAPGTTVTALQNTALTAGGPTVCWVELWGL